MMNAPNSRPNSHAWMLSEATGSATTLPLQHRRTRRLLTLNHGSLNLNLRIDMSEEATTLMAREEVLQVRTPCGWSASFS